MPANAKTELIRHVPLFADCSKQELARIASLADELDVRAGKVLTREGDRGREFFVIVDGAVEVRAKGRKLAELKAGDFFGEVALVSNAPRIATVTATTPLRVLVITDRAFRALLAKSPRIQSKVLQALAKRVAETLL